ncbi:MAG: Crp/Fnr family transcriptional regulator [Betaproteobacteria bacterium]|nr:Crp/Fnr family transcriptional regulator [Betaproteobacteria bacterium]
MHNPFSRFTFGGRKTTLFEDLAARGQKHTFPAGTILIQERTHGDSFFFIEAGIVRVYSTLEDGSDVIIDEHGPGHYVGEMAMETRLRSASVRAMTEVQASEVSRELVLDDIRKRPEHALELLFEMVRRARSTTETVKLLALLDTYKRIVCLIEQLATHPAVPAVIPQPPSNLEIAQRVGSNEHAVSAIMQDLTVEGYIERTPHSLIVKKRLPAHW